MHTKYSTLYSSFINTLLPSYQISKGSLALVATGFASSLAIGAPVQGADLLEQPVATLPVITVTATRTQTAANNTIAQTHVIDSEELKHYKGQTVLDVIQRQPGISITQSGGLGTIGNFYMRGYSNKQILILIDGMRYSSATTGEPSLNLLPAEQIERIEILYGASGSSIYGSDAMGGVIQVFTKGQNIDRSQFSVTAGYGSNDHYLYGASAQLTNKSGTNLSLSVSRNETDGFNAVESGDNFHPDDDGFESTNASITLNQNFSNNLSAGITALYSESTTDIDSYPAMAYEPPLYLPTLLAPALPNAYADQSNGAANAYLKYDTGSNSTKLSYGYSIDESETFDNALDASKSSVFDTKQQNVRLENSTDLAGLIDADEELGQLIVGAEYLKQFIDSTQTYEEDERDISSGFVGYSYAGDNYNLQSNFRLDDNSQYGRNSTYNLGAAIKPTENLTMGANYAKGFRAPNFNELYWPSSGNPNLRPESSDNYEVFASIDSGLQSTRITAFYNEVDDMIAWNNGINKNLNEAEILGATLDSDWRYDSWLAGLSYTYQEAKDASGGATDDNFLPYRPENSATAYVGYQLPKFDVRLEGQYVGNRYSSVANSDKLDNYTLLNIAGNYSFTPELTGSLRVDNITDEDYTLSNQFGTKYATDGTNYFGSLTYTWY